MCKIKFLLSILSICVCLQATSKNIVEIKAVNMQFNKVMAIHDGVNSQYLNDNLDLRLFDKLNVRMGLGLLNVYDKSASNGGIKSTHMNVFSITPFVTPIDTKWVKFNFYAGYSVMNYHSYQAIAWGSWFSPDPSIVLQQIENIYKWKHAVEVNTDLIFRLTKQFSAGINFGYSHFLGERRMWEPEGFFNTGLCITYNFRGNE